MPQVLAIADADRIHEYVFSPHELKMIRGGSALQSRLNRKTMRDMIRVHSGKRIYSGGGTALASFPSSAHAESFGRDISASFRKETEIATVTTAHVDYALGEFDAARKRLGVALELAKNARSEARFPGSSPFWMSCQACGLHPASSWDMARQRLVCAACRIRERWSSRSTWYAANCRPPRDFEQIVEKANPAGYLALVYIDVDRLGRYLHDYANQENTFRHISRAIHSAVTQSLSAVLSRILALLDRDGECRAFYEILLAGGDDAIIAIPAQYVFQFLRDFADLYPKTFRRFTRLVLDATVPPPTFSVAVMFANYRYPIADLIRRAEDRLKSAKRKWPDATSIDFEIVGSTPSTGFVPEHPLQPTSRPYRLSEFLQLAGQTAELKAAGAPSNKVRALYNLAFEAEYQAELEYWFTLSRLEKQHRFMLRRIIETHTLNGSFWQSGDGSPQRATRGADLAEIWDFVPEDFRQ